METSKNSYRTISGILWNKFLDTLHRATWEEIFLVSSKVFCWWILSMVLVFIPESSEKLTMALKYGNFAILKILWTFLLVFFSPFIFRKLKELFSSLTIYLVELFSKISEMKPHGPLYQGIPIIELVDYLFLEDSFSRSEFCDYFWVSRKVFDDIATAFDKLKIFVRGANNSRILSDEYSRADITSILTRASEVWEIRPLIRETKIGYSHRGSMPDILSRNNFTTKPLNHDNGLL